MNYTLLGCLASLCLVGCVSSRLTSDNHSTPEMIAAPVVKIEKLDLSILKSGTTAASSSFHMIAAGIDGLAARIELIDQAQKSVVMQYYIFRGDESGLLVAQALLRAADRGVQVRVLVDDADTVKGDERILALAAHPNIALRIFNPWSYRGHVRLVKNAEFVLKKYKLDHRMHNKLMLVDGSVAIIGGRNIGDQYFQIDPNSQFGDDDVITAGPIVDQLCAEFEEFWNSNVVVPARAIDRAHTQPEALVNLRQSNGAVQGHPGEPQQQLAERLKSGMPLAAMLSGQTSPSLAEAELFYDAPDKKLIVAGRMHGNLIYPPISQQVGSTSSELLIITPYLVPAADELSLLIAQEKRSVRVRILTNSLQAAPDLAAQAGYMRYRPRMTAAGISLYEIRAALGSPRKGSGQGRQISTHGHYALHGKLYVFDRTSLFLGSFNFDERSRFLNTEIGLLIKSKTLAEQSANRFEALTSLDNAYSIVGAEDHAGHFQLQWRTREDGKLNSYSVEPARNWWQRTKVNLLKLLPLDPEL